MLMFVTICVQTEHKASRVIIGCRGQKRLHLAGGGTVRERGWEKRSGARKVDLPVAQLLAAHSVCYLLRLESPVSQGRTVEEAKYVTGDRQVSDRGSGEDLMVTA